MFEFKFPDVGEGITEGNLLKWLVKVGDSVKKETPVAEVETDKAVVEIPSPVDGVVTKLLYKEHDVVIVGKPMMVFDGEISKQEESKQEPNKVEENKNVEESKLSFSSPQINITRSVSQGSSEYLAMPAVRDAAKKLKIDLSQVSASGGVGNITLDDLNSFARSGKNIPRQQTTQQTYSMPIQKEAVVQKNTSQVFTSTSSNPFGVLATPSVRQLARELGVDITKVVGTGDIGKITAEDVRNAVSNNNIKTSTQPQTKEECELDESCKYKTPAGVASETGSGPVEIVKASGVRKIISKRMTESKNTAVHYTVSDEADVTQIVDLREKVKATMDAKGVKLTYLSFFVKAAVLALEKNPKLNSTYDESKEEITYKKFYNIGIAVDTEAGLMVPVIKNCESKTVVDIAMKISELASKARDRKIKVEEMTGGTFTITSVGSISGQFFTQIINQPESAILGLGRIVEKPVVKNGNVVARKMMTLGVTADHRIIDGADAARFLQTLIGYLENPDTMLLELV